jgi:hypothetical protein
MTSEPDIATLKAIDLSALALRWAAEPEAWPVFAAWVNMQAERAVGMRATAEFVNRITPFAAQGAVETIMVWRYEGTYGGRPKDAADPQ